MADATLSAQGATWRRRADSENKEGGHTTLIKDEQLWLDLTQCLHGRDAGPAVEAELRPSDDLAHMDRQQLRTLHIFFI